MGDRTSAQIRDLADHRSAPGSSETERAARAEARYAAALDNAAAALAELGDWGGIDDETMARTALDAAGLPAILDALADAEARAGAARPEAP